MPRDDYMEDQYLAFGICMKDQAPNPVNYMKDQDLTPDICIQDRDLASTLNEKTMVWPMAGDYYMTMIWPITFIFFHVWYVVLGKLTKRYAYSLCLWFQVHPVPKGRARRDGIASSPHDFRI